MLIIQTKNHSILKFFYFIKLGSSHLLVFVCKIYFILNYIYLDYKQINGYLEIILLNLSTQIFFSINSAIHAFM